MKDKLLSVRETARGFWVTRAGKDGNVARLESFRHGALLVYEAARALGVYRNLIYRLIQGGKVRVRRRGGVRVIPCSEVRALRVAWKYTSPTTRMGKRA